MTTAGLKAARAVFAEDRKHYSHSAWFTHRAIWAVAAFRFAQGVEGSSAPIRTLLKPVAGAITLFVRCSTNIEIPTSAVIGPGLHIRHAGPIVIHGATRIGRDCKLITGVVVGANSSERAPIIGNGVTFSVFSAALGEIEIGDGTVIGAHSVVLSSTANKAVMVGCPARDVQRRAHADHSTSASPGSR